MAKIDKLIPFILKWEGGFVNDPQDLGGATNKGITINTFRYYRQIRKLPNPTIEDLKNISDEEWKDILRTFFWDKWQADRITNQSIANILVDWVWASGSFGIKLPQQLLGVDSDGLVGNRTLFAVNTYYPQKELFERLKQARFDFLEKICRSRPQNRKFKKGWENRINDLKFEE